MKPVRQRDLAILLAKVPPPRDPRADLEQYQTPSSIAAEALFLAYARGDVAGKRVVDLGCGTGILALGAAALGGRVTGIDLDERMIEVARATALALDLAAEFRVTDVEAFSSTTRGRGPAPASADAAPLEAEFDTVITNPPFGAQLASRAQGGDKTFLRAAWRLAPVAYSFHLTETLPHLLRFARSNEVDAEPLASFRFPLPATMAFHTKPRKEVDVAFLRSQRA